MDWKEQLDKATAALKQAADSDTVKNLTTKARQTASDLAKRARQGALDAANAYVEANSDPTAVHLHYRNADISILSPSDGLHITRPHAGALVIADATGNSLVISLAGEKAVVAETIGAVKMLNPTTFDLGSEDGVNVVFLKG